MVIGIKDEQWIDAAQEILQLNNMDSSFRDKSVIHHYEPEGKKDHPPQIA